MKTKKVLIVDDEPVICNYISNILIAEGYACHQAGSLEAAKRQFEWGQFTHLIIDLHLPDGSGMDLLKWIHSSEFNTQFTPPQAYIISGNYEDIEGEVARKYNVKNVIHKPFDSQFLVSCLEE